jgi:hypothetical protein
MNCGRLKIGLCAAIVATLVGCAAPGAPQPPSLELARPVRDLKATRKGNEVHLTWSVPTDTIDHHALRHVGSTQICRNQSATMRECTSRVGEVPTPQVARNNKSRFRSGNKSPSQQPPAPQASYTDKLSPTVESQSPTSNFVYAVSVLNSYGRSAGLSNEVQVPSAPTLPPPENLHADLSAHGVELSWSPVTPSKEMPGLRYEYRVYRRETQSGKDSIVGAVPVAGAMNPALLDTSFEWEKTYDYRVTVATLIEQAGGTEQVEGDDTAPVRVFAHDVFAPASPTGLQAVFSGPGQKPFIDLVWKANNESDLAGYNVYRHEAGQPAQKISAQLDKTPAYRDDDVLAGRQYFYSVSAVDVRGNESPQSEEASETVPEKD